MNKCFTHILECIKDNKEEPLPIEDDIKWYHKHATYLSSTCIMHFNPHNPQGLSVHITFLYLRAIHEYLKYLLQKIEKKINKLFGKEDLNVTLLHVMPINWKLANPVTKVDLWCWQSYYYDQKAGVHWGSHDFHFQSRQAQNKWFNKEVQNSTGISKENEINMN